MRRAEPLLWCLHRLIDEYGWQGVDETLHELARSSVQGPPRVYREIAPDIFEDITTKTVETS